MKILFDTSLLIAAMIESHPMHEWSLPWLQRISKKDEGFIAAHTLAELYSTLTKLPIRPKLPSQVVRKLIKQNVVENCRIITLTAKDYLSILDHLTNSNLIGGITYDALILFSAYKCNADLIITLNKKHFVKIFPDLIKKIVSP